MSKHSTSAVTKPFPLVIPNTVTFHPVSLANGLLDISIGIAGSKPGWAVPTWPTLKLPPNAVSPGSQLAIELAKSLVKTLLLVGTYISIDVGSVYCARTSWTLWTLCSVNSIRSVNSW